MLHEAKNKRISSYFIENYYCTKVGIALEIALEALALEFDGLNRRWRWKKKWPEAQSENRERERYCNIQASYIEAQKGIFQHARVNRPSPLSLSLFRCAHPSDGKKERVVVEKKREKSLANAKIFLLIRPWVILHLVLLVFSHHRLSSFSLSLSLTHSRSKSIRATFAQRTNG